MELCPTARVLMDSLAAKEISGPKYLDNLESHTEHCVSCQEDLARHAQSKFRCDDGTIVALSDMLEIWQL
jgi:hypothetical protein